MGDADLLNKLRDGQLTLGQFVTQRREELGCSFQELSAKSTLKLKPSQIAQIEDGGVTDPHEFTVSQLSEVLEVDYEKFLRAMRASKSASKDAPQRVYLDSLPGRDWAKIPPQPTKKNGRERQEPAGPYAKLAKFIRTKREERGWGVADLARKSGVSAQTVYKIESGTANTSLQVAHKLATVLGITVNEVLSQSGSAPLNRSSSMSEGENPSKVSLVTQTALAPTNPQPLPTASGRNRPMWLSPLEMVRSMRGYADELVGVKLEVNLEVSGMKIHFTVEGPPQRG